MKENRLSSVICAGTKTSSAQAERLPDNHTTNHYFNRDKLLVPIKNKKTDFRRLFVRAERLPDNHTTNHYFNRDKLLVPIKNKKTDFRRLFVRAERLELSRLAALDPKSSVSANSTTPAFIKRVCLPKDRDHHTRIKRVQIYIYFYKSKQVFI